MVTFAVSTRVLDGRFCVATWLTNVFVLESFNKLGQAGKLVESIRTKSAARESAQYKSRVKQRGYVP